MSGDSTITITLLIAILGIITSGISLVVTLKKNIKSDTRQDAMAMTTVAVRLESLQDNMKDLKSDFSTNMSDLKKDILSIRSDMNEFRERIVAVEQSTKSAHHRIDMYDQKKKD